MNGHTQLDMEITAFAARLNWVRWQHVARRLDISRATAFRHLGALTQRGLLERHEDLVYGGAVYSATSDGIASSGSAMRQANPSTNNVMHDDECADVLISLELENPNLSFLTEREFISRRRVLGDARHSFELITKRSPGYARSHRPDIICELSENGLFVAIEVERTEKDSRRWRDNLEAYSHRVDREGCMGVLYLTPPLVWRKRIERFASEMGLGDRFATRIIGEDTTSGLDEIVAAFRASYPDSRELARARRRAVEWSF